LRLRPDQKLVYLRNWDSEAERLSGVARLMQALVKIARGAGTDQDAKTAAVPVPKSPPELAKARVGARR
jgi:transcription-repair coupling factor (superfamily II helicase)